MYSINKVALHLLEPIGLNIYTCCQVCEREYKTKCIWNASFSRNIAIRYSLHLPDVQRLVVIESRVVQACHSQRDTWNDYRVFVRKILFRQLNYSITY